MSKRNTAISIIKTILKLSIACGIIFYFIKTGRMNLDAIYLAIKTNTLLIILSFIIVVMAALLTIYRWNLLLKGQEIFLKARDVLSISFIGFFFTTVIPGAVGGDLVKGFYIAQKQPLKRTASIMTVLLDRMIGLAALVLIASIGLTINLKEISKHPALLSLGYMVWMLSLFFVLFFIVTLSKRIYSHKATQYLIQRTPFASKIIKMYDAIHAYRNNFRFLIWSFVISFANHALNILAFFMMTRALNFTELPLYSYFFIVPIGLITTAIPLAPAGIGIGQAAYLKLFEWTLGYKTTIGADAITILQACSLFIFIFGGAYFYITYKRNSLKSS